MRKLEDAITGKNLNPLAAWRGIGKKTRRRAANSEQHFPEKLPSDIVAAPTSTEFLKGLEENT